MTSRLPKKSAEEANRLEMHDAQRSPWRSRLRRLVSRHEIGFAISLFVALAAALFFIDIVRSNLALDEQPVVLGATFSDKYARELGLDWRQTFLASLDELGIRRWRLPAYWDEVEPETGAYDYSAIDWQVDEAAKRDSRIILAVGRKLPRWPECHIPSWAKPLPEEAQRVRLLKYLEETVNHFKDNPAITVWQVENEPFFQFGDCPKPDYDFIRQEIELVRSLDSRPVMVTESGELSTWIRAASLADQLGISTYRLVWNRLVGYFYWPITPLNYRTRAAAAQALVKKVIISEFQAEPWTPNVPIRQVPIAEQLKVMNPERLVSNITFARRVGLPEAYFWGVEWWYWLKQQGHPEMWETARRIFSE